MFWVRDNEKADRLMKKKIRSSYQELILEMLGMGLGKAQEFKAHCARVKF